MTITSERVESLRADVDRARTGYGRDDAPVTVRSDALAALLNAYEDQQARGIHTCHAHCQRTECVLRRERDALVEGVRALVAWVVPRETADNECARVLDKVEDDLTALLARVEGESVPEQGEG